MTFVLTLVVVLYVISHYSSELCDLIGLQFKGN